MFAAAYNLLRCLHAMLLPCCANCICLLAKSQAKAQVKAQAKAQANCWGNLE
jgi:hypothetical protein